jgi:thioredoxin
MILHLNGQNFREAINTNELILVDFWASWCGPCRMLGEVLEEINTTHPEIVIGKVNVDEERPLAMEFQIRSIPQIFIFKNGKIVESISGYVPANTILEAISKC